MIHLSALGKRGFRLALHVDAVLTAHNMVRHGHRDSGRDAPAPRLKHGARSFSLAVGVLRQLRNEQWPSRFRRDSASPLAPTQIDFGERCIANFVETRVPPSAQGLVSGVAGSIELMLRVCARSGCCLKKWPADFNEVWLVSEHVSLVLTTRSSAPDLLCRTRPPDA